MSGSGLNRANHHVQGSQGFKCSVVKVSSPRFCYTWSSGRLSLFREDVCPPNLKVVRSFRETIEEGLVGTFRVCRGPANGQETVGKVMCSGLIENARSPLHLDPLCWWDSWKCERERKYQALCLWSSRPRPTFRTSKAYFKGNPYI